MTSPEEATANAKWNTNAGRALYAIKQSMDDNMLLHIEAMTPKEVWGMFVSMFAKQNAHRLQLLEKEIAT